MSITSLTFLFFFLPLVTITNYYVPNKQKNVVLLFFNIIFYIWPNPINFIFILVSVIFNFFFSQLMISENKKLYKNRKLFFIIAIIINILMLAIFKYTGFIVENLNNIFGLKIKLPKLPFPLGISFFVFQSISFITDIYTEKIKDPIRFIPFSAYITMFPTITSGPIIRYIDISGDLRRRNITKSDIYNGVTKIIYGLGKKVLLANNIYNLWLVSSQIDKNEISVIHSWFLALAYMLYIFFDFSGYSDMAIGCGRLLGFKFSENFNYPYLSKSISDFFRRWHISLGSWFRDYLYIPLGGSREGNFRTFFNIIVVWIVTGFWHGASWNFVIWGLYFGLIIASEKLLFSKIKYKLPELLKHVYSLLLVLIGWVLFFSASFSEIIIRLKIMFGFSGNQIVNQEFLYYFRSYFIIIIISIVGSTNVISNFILKIKINQKKTSLLILPLFKTIIVILSVAYLLDSTHTPFLYANF